MQTELELNCIKSCGLVRHWFDTDQFFSPNFFHMDQLELPAAGKLERALNRCQSVPVGKNMDLTPIHIKSPAAEQQYSEKLEALGVLNGTKSTPVTINQYQVQCFYETVVLTIVYSIVM